MPRRKEDEPAAPETMSFEEATAELETIIERIESGEIGLEESLAQRKRGEALIHRCRGILDAAEQELQQVEAGEAPADDDEEAQEGEGA
jgi:exodeoxyribonuclease VII small subunit